MHEKPDFIISGAGLVGSLLALRLAQRGHRIKVYESRPDMRKHSIAAGRSINLALSDRGIRTLKRVGLEDALLTHTVPMYGRLIHSVEGELQYQPYSERAGEHINSISRRTLNIVLMDALEKIQPDAIEFETKLLYADPEKSILHFERADGSNFTSENIPLLATDGANSMGRKSLMNISTSIRFNYSQVFQNYAYKELTIPPAADGSFRIQNQALHIWPRGHFMMIALPNPDATFTVTLFIPYEGADSLEGLHNKNDVLQYFGKHFSDAVPHIPELAEEFFHNPTGYLYTVKCHPWNYKDSVLLLGDAAHAIIPFYGQGMNCGFEDVFVFDELLDQGFTGEGLFSEFTKLRKPNGDAIADLAEDNFLEMRDKVGDPIFQKKRALENRLEKFDPQYYSKYALVTFRPDISYADAMRIGRKQDDLLMGLCSTNKEIQDSELPLILTKLKELAN